MKIRELMSYNATRILENATMRDAANLVSMTGASDLMVVSAENNFRGVLSEGDLIRAVMPNFAELMADGMSLRAAFGQFVENGKDMATQSIDAFVISGDKLVTYKPEDDVLKAAGTMVAKQIRRLPVVDSEGKLVGTISRSDVCKGILD
ncbi:MAG TPA: hypothetical protein DCQ06_04750 [Myxococcales bacterium]|nr:hypothetical protein [Myxococcales bacterium]HAN30884.1 hypothetical protein [Myxococcales bacterium]